MKDAKENIVTLDTPIQRGETTIADVQVIKPNAGALRGVGLAAIANADVDALLVVLPRVTVPNLTKEECARLELPDLVALAGKVVGFVAELGGVIPDARLGVDDLMADIAVIFHWPPSEMAGMTLTELLNWRHLALQRSGVNHDE